MRPLAAIILCLCSVLVLSGCFGGYDWHQRLTVTVSTPQGERTGSAVARVGWSDVNAMGNFPSSYAGEATMVELGNGRYLFALLGEQTKFIGLRTFLGSPGLSAERFRKMEAMRGVKPVNRAHYPTLVTFGDINDPASVRQVDPGDLAAAFGPGYSLQAITLEITADPVTEGKVEQVLGWWCEYRSKYFVDRYAESVSNDFARNIGGAHFRIGECK